MDPSKAEVELGWHPREGFEGRLSRTVNWFLANGWWRRPLREARHAGGRLGPPGGLAADALA